MMDEQDEDALFDRLARNLEAVRQDAALVRSGGGEGMSAAVARIDTELCSLATALGELRQQVAQQDAVTERLEAAAAKRDADIQGLLHTVEALSERLRQGDGSSPSSPARKPWRRAAAPIGVVLAVLVLGGGVAAWTVAGREPSIGTLAHRFGVQLPMISGIGRAGSGEPISSVQTAAEATPGGGPAARPRAAAALGASATPGAAPASAASSTLAAESPLPGVAPLSPSPAPPSPVEAAAVFPPPPGATSVAAGPLPIQAAATEAPPPAEAPAGEARQPAQTAAAILLPSMAPPPIVASPPAPIAASPPAQSETQASAATTPDQAPQPRQAVHQIVLRATADTWVRVRQNGGRVLLTSTMKPGETWHVPAEADLMLDTGNSAGLDLLVDGVLTRLKGAPGGVVHNIPLEADLLRSGAAMRLGH